MSNSYMNTLVALLLLTEGSTKSLVRKLEIIWMYHYVVIELLIYTLIGMRNDLHLGSVRPLID